MAQIKNLALLEGLTDADIAKMEHAATEHKRYGSLMFKIVETDKKSVTIQVVQEKNAAGVYHNQKRLIEIVHETFDRFFPAQKVRVRAIPYEMPAPRQVTPKWVNERMLSSGTKLKEVAKETGIDYTRLSALISGDRPMSQVTQAMFYFYFQGKGARTGKQVE